MNKINQDNMIKQRYDALFQKENGKSFDEETFLDALIALESAGKIRLFRTLLGGKTKEEVRDYLNSKGRDDWEKIVSKEFLGKKMTIVDVINQYSKMIKDTFKTKPTKEALKELGIQSDKLDGVILPPEGNQRIRPGTSEGGEESEEKKRLKFKEYQEKIKTLFSDILTVENGVHPGDLEVFEGKNEKDMVRYTSYIAVKIPKLGKTIFINDREGESTFVCDKLVSQHDMTTKSKKKFHEELGSAFHSVNYSDKTKEQWKRAMIDLIFGPEKGSRKIVREALINKNGELTEMGKKRFNTKPNMNDRGTFKLFNRMGYYRINGIFGIKGKLNDLIKDFSFYKLSAAMFGEENPNVRNLKKLLMTPEEIKTELFQRQDERFNVLGGKARKPFKLSNGMGYKRFGKKFGIKVDGQFNLKQFYDLSVAIFGKNHPKVKKLKTKIDKINTNYEEIKTELFQRQDERFRLDCSKGNNRRNFKLSNGIGYYKIAGMFGIEGIQTELKKDPAFYKLSVAIFGENHPKVEELKIKLDKKKINLDKIVSEIHNREDERFRLDCSKGNHRRNFKLSNGIGYCKIAGIFGVKRNTYNDLYKDDAFYDLSVAIFGESHPKVKELKKLLMTLEEIKTELFQRQDERFKLNTNDDCRSFKLSNGKGYVTLARLFGLQEPENDLFKDEVFYKLSAAIFGEDNENVKSLRNKLDKKQKHQS